MGGETKAAAVRGIRQTAYEVSVSGTKNLRGNVWDSGKVQGNRSFQVIYGGKPLQSGAIYFWRVRIWDQSGQASTWSEPAQFRMGLLNPEDWTAKWIAADAAHQASEPLPIFRCEFRVTKPVAEAMVCVSGLGQY